MTWCDLSSGKQLCYTNGTNISQFEKEGTLATLALHWAVCQYTWNHWTVIGIACVDWWKCVFAYAADAGID